MIIKGLIIWLALVSVFASENGTEEVSDTMCKSPSVCVEKGRCDFNVEFCEDGRICCPVEFIKELPSPQSNEDSVFGRSSDSRRHHRFDQVHPRSPEHLQKLLDLHNKEQKHSNALPQIVSPHGNHQLYSHQSLIDSHFNHGNLHNSNQHSHPADKFETTQSHHKSPEIKHTNRPLHFDHNIGHSQSSNSHHEIVVGKGQKVPQGPLPGLHTHFEKKPTSNKESNHETEQPGWQGGASQQIGYPQQFSDGYLGEPPLPFNHDYSGISHAHGYSAGISRPYSHGYSAGISRPYSHSYSAGISRPYTHGYFAGISRPYSHGYSAGISRPYSHGYSAGISRPYSHGYSAGISRPYSHGYSAGISHPYSHGYSAGISHPYSHGYSAGISRPYSHEYSAEIPQSYNGFEAQDFHQDILSQFPNLDHVSPDEFQSNSTQHSESSHSEINSNYPPNFPSTPYPHVNDVYGGYQAPHHAPVLGPVYSQVAHGGHAHQSVHPPILNFNHVYASDYGIFSPDFYGNKDFFAGLSPYGSDLLLNHKKPAQCGVKSSGLHHDLSPYSLPTYGSSFGVHPWQAAVFGWSNEGYSLRCSATLISEHLLVTSAHCISDIYEPDLKVVLGAQDLLSPSPPIPALERTVENLFIHEEYDSSSLAHDIALIFLSHSIDLEYTPHIAPACLPSEGQQFLPSKCRIVGWPEPTINHYGEQTNNEIKATEVNLLSATQCRAEITKLAKDLNPAKVTPEMHCIKGRNDTNACIGAGGGAVLCEVSKNDTYCTGHHCTKENVFLGGIVSWTNELCGTDGLAVITEVSPYSHWIQNLLKRYGLDSDEHQNGGYGHDEQHSVHGSAGYDSSPPGYGIGYPPVQGYGSHQNYQHGAPYSGVYGHNKLGY